MPLPPNLTNNDLHERVENLRGLLRAEVPRWIASATTSDAKEDLWFFLARIRMTFASVTLELDDRIKELDQQRSS